MLAAARPIFEAGFAARGAVAFADVLLPATLGDATAWHLIEVKSSASLKDTHREDAAIQAWIARGAASRTRLGAGGPHRHALSFTPAVATTAACCASTT